MSCFVWGSANHIDQECFFFFLIIEPVKENVGPPTSQFNVLEIGVLSIETHNRLCTFIPFVNLAYQKVKWQLGFCSIFHVFKIHF